MKTKNKCKKYYAYKYIKGELVMCRISEREFRELEEKELRLRFNDNFKID